MRAVTKALGVLLAGALLVALGALSRAPIQGEHAGSAALRLTWRVRGEEVGECLRPSAEELAQLPAHMQNPDGCVASIPPYRLTAEVDGAMRADAVVEAAGARGDRPLYVYHELLLEPGTHQLRVRFARADGEAAGGGGASDIGALEYEGSVTLGAGEVLLLTRGEEGRLEVREPVS